jgi:ketosteroid isomerase-like protein
VSAAVPADALALIGRYYAACDAADRAALRATFCDDVVHYFTHHAPVRGADALAEHWACMQPRIAGHWTVDHGLAQGDEAVIEWTLRWTPPGASPQLMRGTEWYRLRDGRIAEIRAYYLNPQAPYLRRDFELEGFDYAARGLPLSVTPPRRTPA